MPRRVAVLRAAAASGAARCMRRRPLRRAPVTAGIVTLHFAWHATERGMSATLRAAAGLDVVFDRAAKFGLSLLPTAETAQLYVYNQVGTVNPLP
jgi:hypothetical protein